MLTFVLGLGSIIILISFLCVLFTMYCRVTCKHSKLEFFVSIASIFTNAFVFGFVAISISFLFRFFLEETYIADLVAPFISGILATVSYVIARKIISPLDTLLEAGRVTNNKQ